MHHNFEARKKKFSWAVVAHRTSGGPSAQEAEAAGSAVQVPAQSGYTEKHYLETKKKMFEVRLEHSKTLSQTERVLGGTCALHYKKNNTLWGPIVWI